MTEETLFHEALAKSSAERAAFLDAACSGQPRLRAAVEGLLAAHERSGHVLDQPPAGLASIRWSSLPVATGGQDGEVKLWDARTGQEVQRLPSRAQQQAAAIDDRAGFGAAFRQHLGRPDAATTRS